MLRDYTPCAFFCVAEYARSTQNWVTTCVSTARWWTCSQLTTTTYSLGDSSSRNSSTWPTTQWVVFGYRFYQDYFSRVLTADVLKCVVKRWARSLVPTQCACRSVSLHNVHAPSTTALIHTMCMHACTTVPCATLIHTQCACTSVPLHSTQTQCACTPVPLHSTQTQCVCTPVVCSASRPWGGEVMFVILLGGPTWLYHQTQVLWILFPFLGWNAYPDQEWLQLVQLSHGLLSFSSTLPFSNPLLTLINTQICMKLSECKYIYICTVILSLPTHTIPALLDW